MVDRRVSDVPSADTVSYREMVSGREVQKRKAFAVSALFVRDSTIHRVGAPLTWPVSAELPETESVQSRVASA